MSALEWSGSYVWEFRYGSQETSACYGNWKHKACSKELAYSDGLALPISSHHFRPAHAQNGVKDSLVPWSHQSWRIVKLTVKWRSGSPVAIKMCQLELPSDVRTRFTLTLKKHIDFSNLVKESTDVPNTLLLFLTSLQTLIISINDKGRLLDGKYEYIWEKTNGQGLLVRDSNTESKKFRFFIHRYACALGSGRLWSKGISGLLSRRVILSCKKAKALIAKGGRSSRMPTMIRNRSN